MALLTEWHTSYSRHFKVEKPTLSYLPCWRVSLTRSSGKAKSDYYFLRL